MAFKIFRFELLSEVGRSGGNTIYDVQDTANNSRARLYEWTPLLEKAAEASSTFYELRAQLNGLEAFTAGTRFYLVEIGAQARKELELLRSRGLFSGNWPFIFDEPAASPDLPDAVEPGPTQKDRNKPWVVLFSGACVCILALLIWAFSLRGDIKRIGNDLEKSKAEGQTMAGQEETLNQNLEAVRTELNRERDFLAKHQDSEADMAYAAFHLAEENAKPASGYYQLNLENQCALTPLFVVARYLDMENRWVTRGWWTAISGQVLLTDLYSKDGIIFVYAENNGKRVTLSDTNELESITEDVLTRTFIRQSPEILTDPNKRTVSMIRLHLVPGSFQIKASFPCPT